MVETKSSGLQGGLPTVRFKNRVSKGRCDMSDLPFGSHARLLLSVLPEGSLLSVLGVRS